MNRCKPCEIIGLAMALLALLAATSGIVLYLGASFGVLGQ